ncbi:MAG TPA: SDR family oxidoreductase [Aquabacterium sp.]|nr:SDR family oxidoreductase [Aquabacterium sp.]
MDSMKGSVAWITGGSSGIGLAAARAFARLGSTVVISGRGLEALERAKRELRELGADAHHAAFDVTDADACVAVAQQILARHGRIDVLVNSAGLNVARRSWSEVSLQGWNDVFAANVNGTFHCIAAVLPAMRERRSGHVVNVSSWAGRFDSRAAGPAYVSAKHAVSALTRSLNMEEFPNGIRATALCPGEVATPIMARRAVPPTPEQLATMLQVEDLEATFSYLAQLPVRVCVNEIVLSPTQNGAFGRPGS